MRISYILPCFNVEQYISDGLQSLFSQGLSEDEFEVICINDCSTDNTRSVISSFQLEHPNIILLDQPRNMYSGAARNRGLDVAKGDYIWFVDSDDMVKPDIIQVLLQKVFSDDLDILLFNYDEFKDGRPDIYLEHEDIFRETGVMTGCEFVEKEFDCHLSKLSLLWLRLVRRSFIEQNHIRFSNLYISQDCPFAWESLLLANRVKSIKNRCYNYRSNAGSITSNKNTAKKASVWSFEFPEQLKIVEEKVKPMVSVRIIQELEKNIRHEVNQFVSRYNQLPQDEKTMYFKSMQGFKNWYPRFKSYLSRKHRLAYLSGFLGEDAFAKVASLII